ncbi:MAG TPA: aldolase/citrate lyase family protein, partial [Hyphomicrobiaceae bacterium]|nr:aldolase/citrate lyase family protein [Hyphomicrobiaceae bacterium]
GVQVPHVNTADDARAAVAAVKFGPGAARGLAAGTRPDRWGLGARMPDFVAAANAQSFVCVQIEHAEAVANAAEIAAVPGVDVVFIGPSDLSQSMGHPGNPKAPAVAAAIRQTLAVIRDSGKAPGMPATSDTLGEVLGEGCRYIYTHLPRILGAGARLFLDAGKSRKS